MTKLPLVFKPRAGKTLDVIGDGEGKLVAIFKTPIDPDFGELIVASVNSHARQVAEITMLRQALAQLVAALEAVRDVIGGETEMANMIDDALRAAE